MTRRIAFLLLSLFSLAASASTPYSGSPIALPGRIEAENFDNGGEGDAYHDSIPGNSATGFRTGDSVDTPTCTDTGCGRAVGDIAIGEWLKYTISAASAATYTLNARVSSAYSGAYFHVEIDGENATRSLSVPYTGGFAYFTTVTLAGVSIPSGTHVIKLVAESNLFNVNWIEFVQKQSPYSGTAFSLPGTIELENYDVGGEGIAYHDSDSSNTVGGASPYRTDGVDVGTCKDGVNGYCIQAVTPGEWFEYAVTSGTAASYNWTLRYATSVNSGTISIMIDGVTRATATTPDSGGANKFASSTGADLIIPAGTHTIRLLLNSPTSNNLSLNSFALTAPQTPYGSSARTVGVPFQAEEYDLGGEGAAYHDSDAVNQPGSLRSDGVDLATCSDAAYPGSCYTVTFMYTGEWLEYTVDVPYDGTYEVVARAASLSTSGAEKIHQQFAGQAAGPLVVVATGGNNIWQNLSLGTVTLSAGRQILRVAVDGGNATRINLLSVNPVSAPYLGARASVPGTIQAEDFDEGAEGAAYHDTDSFNAGGQYRTTGVDIEATNDAGGGYDVTSMANGEWLQYTVNVARPGSYTLTARVAATSATSLSYSGYDIGASGSISVPATGGSQMWSTVATTVNLPAGVHILKLTANGALALNWLQFDPVLTSNLPPSIALTGPEAGTYTEGEALSLSANAYDADGSVATVEFLVNGTALPCSATAPYSCTWNPSRGTYAITVRATDNLGVSSTSAPAAFVINAAPTVSLDSVVQTDPSTVTITATASDVDGTISRVEFYSQGIYLGSVSQAPYVFLWANGVASDAVVMVVAYDNAGAASIVSQPAKDNPPACTWTLRLYVPVTGVLYPTFTNVALGAYVSSRACNVGEPQAVIDHVEFYDGSTRIATAGSNHTPLTATWKEPARGVHSVWAKAFLSFYGDQYIKATTSPIEVVVDTAPTVSIDSSVGSAFAYPSRTPITLAATAFDSDYGDAVTQVQFFAGTSPEPLCTATSSTSWFACSWSSPAAGIYSIAARATDSSGGTATSTPPVSVRVDTAPTVTFSAPSQTTYAAGATISLSATAADPDAGDSITKVEFYSGGSTLLCTATTTPFSCPWANVPQGTYSVTAKAFDSLGLTATSAPAVQFVIGQNQSPTITLVKPTPTPDFLTDSYARKYYFNFNANTYQAGQVAHLEATVDDPDDNIAKVEFFIAKTTGATVNAGQLIASVTASSGSQQTFAADVVLPPAQATHNVEYIYAVATDNLGQNALSAISYYAPVAVVPSSTALVACGTIGWFFCDGTATSINIGPPLYTPFMLEAERYDAGGQGVSYFKVLNEVSPGFPRGDDNTLLADCAGDPTTPGCLVGDVALGEMLAYTIDITNTDTYFITLNRYRPPSEAKIAQIGSGPGAVYDPQWFSTTTSKLTYVKAGMTTTLPAGVTATSVDFLLDGRVVFTDSDGSDGFEYFWTTPSKPGTYKLTARAHFAHGTWGSEQFGTNVVVSATTSPGGSSAGPAVSLGDLPVLEQQPSDGFGLELIPIDSAGRPAGTPIVAAAQPARSASAPAGGNAGDVTDSTAGDLEEAWAVTATLPSGRYVMRYRSDVANEGIAVDSFKFAHWTNPAGAVVTVLTPQDGSSWKTGNPISLTTEVIGVSHVNKVEYFQCPAASTCAITCPSQFACTLGSDWVTASGASSPTVAPYQWNWQPAAGAYKLTAKATGLINTGTFTLISQAISVTVVAGTNQAPVVQWLWPSSNTSVVPGSTLTLQASARDDDVGGSISSVQFLDGSSVLCNFSQPSGGTQQCSWAVGNAQKVHHLTVTATDNGNASTSKNVDVTVTNASGNIVGDDPSYVGNWSPSQTSDLGATNAFGSVSLKTGVSGGAASAEVPIEIPPGRHGMQPALSLSYSSRGGNGVAGMGWNIAGTSAIHRCPQTVAQDGVNRPVDFSNQDRLCLDGQRLMLVAGSGPYGFAGAEYRTEVDSFSRIKQLSGDIVTAGAGTNFLIETKSGDRLYYGNTTDSRIITTVGVSGTLSWNINRRQDRAGNETDFVYQTAGSGESLLQKVYYTGLNGAFGDRLVQFDYKDRPANSTTGANDVGATYLAGALIEQTKRLSTILTKVGSQVVRTYTLNYALGTSEVSSYSGRSLLRDVRMCAGSNLTCVPKIVFTWQETPQPRSFGRITALDPIEGSPATDDSTAPDASKVSSLTPLADVDGDGILEMLATVGAWDAPTSRYQLKNYLVKFRADRSAQYRLADDLFPAGANVQGKEQIDLDNDGRAELYSRVYVSQHISNDPRTLWGSPTCTQYNNSQYLKVCTPDKVKLQGYRWRGTRGADLNAPGVGFDQFDFGLTNNPIYVESGRIYVFNPGGMAASCADHQCITIAANESASYFADVDGDGLPDLIVQRTPWGADDPMAMAHDCDDDGMGVSGPEIFVYKNTSVRTATTSTISFSSTPMTLSKEQRCVHGEDVDYRWTVKRNQYDRLSTVKDFDGDGIPDLSVVGSGREGRIRFGKRVTPIEWPINDDTYEVTNSNLGPGSVAGQGMSIWEGPRSASTIWLDVNGDGLQDVYYRASCDEGARQFVRLNTGKKGKLQLLGPAAVVTPWADSSDATATNCTSAAASVTNRPNYNVPADIDSDGRQEILYPTAFASRICTNLTIQAANPPGPGSFSTGGLMDLTDDGSSSGNPIIAQPNGDPDSPETYYFCPEPPDSSITSQPLTMIYQGATEPARPMYGESHSQWDDSTYVASAYKFVELPRISGSNKPRFRQVSVQTSIVTNASGGGAFDVFGDGLDDSLLHVGCRLNLNNGFPACLAATSATVYTGQCSGTGCSYGPSTFPGTTIPVSATGAFISENLGTSYEGPGFAPDLPDMLESATVRSGSSSQTDATTSTWSYQPLSSSAGRTASDIPLYLAAADPLALDKDHFYFTSSMPVVSSFTQSDALGSVQHTYGYRDAMYNSTGRGMRGFRTIIDEVDAVDADVLPGTRTLTQFRQVFPMSGLPDCIVTTSTLDPISAVECPTDPENSNASALSVEKRGYSAPSPSNSGVYDVELSTSQRWTYDPGTRKKVSSSESLYAYDPAGFGNVSGEHTTVWDWNAAGSTKVVQREQLSSNKYVNDTTNWWIGQLVGREVDAIVSYLDSSVALPSGPLLDMTKSTTTLFAYDPTTRQVNCQTTYAKDDALIKTDGSVRPCSDKSYGGWESTTSTLAFDTYGNPTSTKVEFAPHDGTSTPLSRTSSALWIPTDGTNPGYFPVQATNPASHLTCTTVDPAFGVPTKVRRVMSAGGSCTTGNALETLSELDAFGREIKRTAPVASDLSQMEPNVRTARQWCTGARCASSSQALYREVVEQQGSPTRIRYFNARGNVLGEQTDGFNSPDVVLTEHSFDAFGRGTFDSTPAYGSSSAYGVKKAYDAFGRLTAKWSAHERLDGVSTGDEYLLTAYSYGGLDTAITVKSCDGVVVSTSVLGSVSCSGVHGKTLTMSRTYGSDGKVLSTSDASTPTPGVTSYWYDGGGNPVAIRDANSKTTWANYDELGRRISSSDPNQGDWTFVYNGLGELYSQTDARGIKSTYSRDLLGRPLTRTWNEPHSKATDTTLDYGTDTWVYDTLGNGLPTSEERTVRYGGAANPQTEHEKRLYHYDSLYRVDSTTTTLLPTGSSTEESFVVQQYYDKYYGRLKQTAWPGGVSVAQRYNLRGFGTASVMAADYLDTTKYLRRVDGMAATGVPTAVSMSNGIMTQSTQVSSEGRTSRVCDYANGVGCGAEAYNANKLLDLTYRYDGFGNVSKQSSYGAHPSVSGAITETFQYDELHRLKQSDSNTSSTVKYDYDAVGNFKFKNDYSAETTGSIVNPYEYGTGNTSTANDAGPNAVTKVWQPLVSPCTTSRSARFWYDNNGNQTIRTRECNGATQATEVSDYNVDNLVKLVAEISTGVSLPLTATTPALKPSTAFRYGTDGLRYAQQLQKDTSARNTVYVGAYERDTVTGGYSYVENRYDVAPGVLYVVSTLPNRSGTFYTHGDRLGSDSTLTKADGTVAEMHGYDAFGTPRSGDWNIPNFGTFTGWYLNNPNNEISQPSVTRDGFTGHEHLDQFGLIHMNGRTYDYRLGRFLSVDPIIQFPTNSQSLNPYSYILNNPLSGTDPTGYACDGSASDCKFEIAAGSHALPSSWNSLADFKNSNATEGATPTGTEMCRRTDTAPSDIGKASDRQASVMVGPQQSETSTDYLKLAGNSAANSVRGVAAVRALYACAKGESCTTLSNTIETSVIVFTSITLGAGGAAERTAVTERVVANDSERIVERAETAAKGPGTNATSMVVYDADLARRQIMAGGKGKATDIASWAEGQGWTRSQAPTGPVKYVDPNGVVRVTIKRGSARTPGSEGPHVELRNASGQRIDPLGNPVTRRNPNNHIAIEYDLP